MSQNAASVRARRIQRALDYIWDGKPVIPLSNKLPLVGWKQFQTELPTDNEVATWPWDRATGMAMVIGAALWQRYPLLWVLDIEQEHRTEAEAWLDVHARGWRSARLVESGSGGLHVYCIAPRPVKTTPVEWGDIKGENSIVVLPMSKSDKGAYRLIHDGEPLHLDPQHIPGYTETKPPLREILSEPIPNGKRNETLFRLGSKLRGDGMDPGIIESVLQQVNSEQCDPPLPRDDVTIIAQSSSKYTPNTTINLNGHHRTNESQTFNRTDTGNAERLVHLHGHNVRFNWGRGVWHVWNGLCWDPDESGRLEQLAKETVRAIPGEADGISDDDQRGKILKWAASSESAGKREAMVRLARSEPGIPVTPDQLDSDPWLLNVLNGTLDMRTGALRSHDRSDYITRVINTNYDPEATCPQFDSFLDTIMGGDQELVEYLWRLMGYSLTGSTREQIVIITYGHGGNGKTTLLSTIRDLLGDYAREADADSFMEQRGGAIREDIADLDGARFVSASETRDGQRLSEALIKKMTGGERLRARRLYENGYEFLPQFKVWLSTNHKPTIQGTEHAIWRRIRLVPFAVTIPKSEQDPELPAKLRAEWPGILARAVQGCMDWQSEGLTTPKAVQEATDQYRDEMDVLTGWISDECVLGADKSATAKDLYRSYHNWCEAAGEKPLAQRWFGARLVERGFDDYRSNKARYWIGIGLRHDEAS